MKEEKEVVIINQGLHQEVIYSYAVALAGQLDGLLMIRLFTDVDAAWGFLEQNHENVACVVTEILLDTGKLFANRREELNMGRSAGLALCDKIHELSPGMPVVFLSIATDPELVESATGKPHARFLYKLETTESGFVQAVLTVLGIESKD